MNQDDRRRFLIEELLRERPSCRRQEIPEEPDFQKMLLRGLMNVRQPSVVSRHFLEVQDAYLQEEVKRKGITRLSDLSPIQDSIYLWRGDITLLECGAIVNAANSGMTGCYQPCHNCIDNCIHTYAGLQLRLKCAEIMEQQGYEVTYLDVDEFGEVKLSELKKAIRPDTILISIMFANNEIGTIQPIKEIGEIAHEHGILFHTDAVQAFGQVPIDVDELHIDMLSSSGHKLHGPKGIGFLYIRKGVKIGSFVHGGAQERKRRAGTENVPGIVGYGKAASMAAETMAERTAKEVELRDYLIERVMKEVPYTRLNGHPKKRLPNNANFSFQFVEGESLLIMLDMEGICGSSGSACTSGSLDPSHVLLAIGLPHEIAHGSLRLTLSEETTKEDIDYTVEAVKKIVERLRSMSPLYEDFVKKQR